MVEQSLLQLHRESTCHAPYFDLWTKQYLYVITIVIFIYSFFNKQIHYIIQLLPQPLNKKEELEKLLLCLKTERIELAQASNFRTTHMKESHFYRPKCSICNTINKYFDHYHDLKTRALRIDISNLIKHWSDTSSNEVCSSCDATTYNYKPLRN